jgi:hypothetical protein
MTDIDPKILELAKKDYGENCELVKRTANWRNIAITLIDPCDPGF